MYSDGKPVRLGGIVVDITERKKFEQRLRETQKLEAIGTLAGGIAHDFNNILAAIIGYTELATDQVEPKSQLSSDLKKISKAGYRARDMINQILMFSRQREQERRPITVTPIIKETIKLLRASLPSTIEIRQSLDPEPGMVLADATQIHQILMNLCTNSAQAMKEKGGILEIGLTTETIDSDFVERNPRLHAGPHLKLSISDTGSGMTKEIMERIFEPYFTTKEKSGGTGLGLAVVHGIVNASEGTITVYSEPDKGTTVNVFLPVIERAQASEKNKPEPVLKGSERILLVDDEQDLVDVGKRILESLGYQVTITTSSMKAIEIFEKNPDRFDLIITDMTMPFLTGDDLAQEIMRIRPDIPIIVCTGYSEKLSEERALSMGIRAYLGKPLLKTEIAKTVRNVLDRHGEEYR